MEIIEESPLAGEDSEDLARTYKKALQDLKEQQEYVNLIKAELANRCLDQPGKYLVTEYGAFKAHYRPPRLNWDRKRLAETVYRMVQEGKIGADPSGELQGNDDYRVYKTLLDVFRLEPRKSKVKALGINVDEYAVEGSDGVWDLKLL